MTKLLSDEEGNSFEVDSSTKDKENDIRHHYYKNTVTRETIHADKIHELTLKRVEEYFQSENLLNEIMTEFSKKEKSGVAPIEANLRKMKSRLAEIAEDEKSYVKRLISSEASLSKHVSEAIEREIDAIQEEKVQIQNKISEQEAYKQDVLNDSRPKDHLSRIKDLAKGFRKMTGTAQKAYLAKIFHKIVILKDNKVKFEIKIRKPNPLSPSGVVTVEDKCSIKEKNGGSEGTRTLGLLRDRQTL